MQSLKRRGVTIIELTVVLLILSILATIAASVYAGYVTRAKYSVARSDIRNLELAATRYQVDTGAFPISSSGDNFGSSDPNPQLSLEAGTLGCGYLILSLRHSLSGDAFDPASPRWSGPYIEIDQKDLGVIDNSGNITQMTSSTPLPRINFLDPWGNPYYYVRSEDYFSFGATEVTDSPFVEPFYNPSTVQIYSKGQDGQTLSPPQAGLDTDDVNNFNSAN
ncbi:MAG: prepilin-type N-terminal cleavage/methylation domain-containing protein [Candidatus Sumerlaeia bacterium]